MKDFIFSTGASGIGKTKKNPDEYEVWEKALMEAGDKKCDWTDKSYIAPILETIR